MRDGAADEPGARSRGRGGLGAAGVLRQCEEGLEEIAQYRDEAWGAQSPKIRPSSSQRQQGGPEKSKPAGFVADGQFQPKCLGSEFSRQIAVDFESNANLHKRGSCPGHSHLPFLSEEHQTYNGPFQVARSAGRDMRKLPCGGIGVAEFPSEGGHLPALASQSRASGLLRSTSHCLGEYWGWQKRQLI